MASGLSKESQSKIILRVITFSALQVFKRNYRELLSENMIDASSLKVDHMVMRRRLGLQNEIIDYKRLFAR
jgi:hypothetical protein|tara:strand:- start:406 stop:618 length:213 start_codon:yes stop_codon:yes gene_type:complete